MSLLYGAKFIYQNATANKPHIHGFLTARTVADDDLAEWWNGATVAGIKAAIDKDGKYYSAALTAGDILFGVTGGITNVRRLDSLAIGAAGTMLRSSGTVPAWSTATFPLTAAAGDLLHASAVNVWTSLAKGTANQLLQMNSGATLPEWTSTVNAATATALQTARTINGVSFDGTANITVAAAAGTLTGTTLAAGVVNSSLVGVGVLNAGSIAGGFGSINVGTAEITTTGAVSTGALATTTINATALIVTQTPATGGAMFRLPHGVAPTSPVNGDVWTTNAGLFVRVNGSTVGPLT